MLQAELEAKTKELSEKMEQVHQQVRNNLKNARVTYFMIGLLLKYLIELTKKVVEKGFLLISNHSST